MDIRAVLPSSHHPSVIARTFHCIRCTGTRSLSFSFIPTPSYGRPISFKLRSSSPSSRASSLDLVSPPVHFDLHGCDTVFVTPTARTIDLAAAWTMKRAVILFLSPNMRQSISKLLNKYIFFADKVDIEDITEKTHFFTIMGPKCDQAWFDFGSPTSAPILYDKILVLGFGPLFGSQKLA
ncbi:hypothetical protein L7F22_027861 [Adiantum nelumboides]|nr:hypothetical protein [Adiantum nelumboides]